MGIVSDTIKGTPKRKAREHTNQNLLDEITAMMDEVSDLTTLKDDDTQTEGEAVAPENIRKAGSLRAVHALLSAAKTLLENY